MGAHFLSFDTRSRVVSIMSWLWDGRAALTHSLGQLSGPQNGSEHWSRTYLALVWAFVAFVTKQNVIT